MDVEQDDFVFINKINKIKEMGVGPRLPHDPFFKDGNDFHGLLKKFGLWQEDDEDFYHEPVSEFGCHVLGCQKSFDTMYEYDQHYNASHRYVCSDCKKTLQTAHLLDLHICENHDSYFATLATKKPMYQCYLEECKLLFESHQTRKEHCLDSHKFPKNFKFELPKKELTREANVARLKAKPSKTKPTKGTSSKENEDYEMGEGPTGSEKPSYKKKTKILGSFARGGKHQLYGAFVSELKASLPRESSSDNEQFENS